MLSKNIKVTIIDYGMGNIKSIVGALKYLKIKEILVSGNVFDIASSDKLILPGVGSFPAAMENIKKLGIDEHLKDVVGDGKPILGICLGMQIMGESSTEGEGSRGLGFIKGKVCEIKKTNVKIPHVGFNQVDFARESKLFKGLDNLSDFYFVHSYHMESKCNINQSICHYGDDFIASYEKDNVAGVQFHPELSQTNGLKLLNNFIKHF